MLQGEAIELQKLAEQFRRAVHDPLAPPAVSSSATEDLAKMPHHVLLDALKDAESQETQVHRDAQSKIVGLQTDLREAFAKIRCVSRELWQNRQKLVTQSAIRQRIQSEVHSRHLETTGWGALPAHALLHFLGDTDIVAMSVSARLLRRHCLENKQLVVPHLNFLRGSRKNIPNPESFWRIVHSPSVQSIEASLHSRATASVILSLFKEDCGLATGCIHLSRMCLAFGVRAVAPRLLARRGGEQAGVPGTAESAQILLELEAQLPKIPCLSHLALTDARLEAWKHELVRTISSCTALTSLDLSNAGLSDRSVAALGEIVGLPLLHELRLSRNSLGSASLLAVAEGIVLKATQASHEKLSLKLELRQNSVVLAGMEMGNALRNLVVSGIRALDLTGCDIEESCLISLFEALRDATELETLSLARTQIEDAHCLAIAHIIPHCSSTLKLIDLQGNALSEDSQKVLKRAVDEASSSVRIETDPSRRIDADLGGIHSRHAATRVSEGYPSS